MSEITGREFGRLEGRFDALDDKMDLILEGQRRADESRDKINARLTKIENDSAFGSGRNTAYGTLAGLFGGAVMAWIGKHI